MSRQPFDRHVAWEEQIMRKSKHLMPLAAQGLFWKVKKRSSFYFVKITFTCPNVKKNLLKRKDYFKLLFADAD